MMENIESYSNNDLLNLFYTHGECGRVVRRTCRLFNERYPHLPRMTPGKFTRFEARFIATGNVTPTRSHLKPIINNEDNEVNVLAYFQINRRSSTRAAELDLGISRASIHRILRKHKMHPFSEIIVHGFRLGDEIKRVEFCEFMCIKMTEDPMFLQNIIWTDESKFSRQGIINRRNNHYWAQNNPYLTREHNHQDHFSFNVFCLIMDNRVAYQVYDENLNGARYLEILRGFVRNFLNALPPCDRPNIWYQLDGAPAHSTTAVYHELTTLFEDRWIGRQGPWKWPPRSPDLTPLDFYLWGRVKELVYSRPVQTREELLNRVHHAFTNLNPDELRRSVSQGVHDRVIQCLNQNGGHIEQLL